MVDVPEHDSAEKLPSRLKTVVYGIAGKELVSVVQVVMNPTDVFGPPETVV